MLLKLSWRAIVCVWGWHDLAGCRPAQRLTTEQAEGKHLYDVGCAHCHEENDLHLKKVPPNLHGLFDRSTLPDGAAGNGCRGGAGLMTGKGMMPSFAYQMTKEQMDAVVAYLHTGLRDRTSIRGGELRYEGWSSWFRRCGQDAGCGILKHGHQTMIGTRDAAKLAEWQRKNPKAQVGSFSETRRFGEVLVLAVKGRSRPMFCALAGSANLDGKLVMDACNPDRRRAAGEWSFEVLHHARRFADGAAAARVSQSPLCQGVQLGGRAADGESAVQSRASRRCLSAATTTAPRRTAQILEQFGWETADMGKVESARAIEPLCMLWCVLGFTKNEWTHAFKLLHQ